MNTNPKCPICNHSPFQSAFCNNYNRLFDCKIVESHQHHWCLNCHHWIQIGEIQLSGAANLPTNGQAKLTKLSVPQDEIDEKKRLDAIELMGDYDEF